MSIIAVKKIPFRCSLPNLVKMVAKIIKGQFEALNFANDKHGEKLCYLRLSERLDPQQVVERIQTMTKFGAFIPDHVPDLPLASKRGRIPFKLRRSLKIQKETKPEDVLVITHNEILTEMQSKYTGLYNLSKKIGHKLLDSIAQTIFQRLKHILETNEESLVSGFMLSKYYRKLHPHFGDFQLILSTLHKLQDATGVPRAQLSESELIAVGSQPSVVDNIPFDKIQSACMKYSDKIIAKVTEHVNSLNTDTADGDTEEDLARKRVREELKKISPYLPMIIKQVVSSHFIPQKTPYLKVRIYGEPFLPTKEQMSPFVKRYHAVKIMRSDRMFNILRFNVPLQHYGTLLAMDGTVVGGAKLTIRSSDVPLYKPNDALIAQMKAVFGVAHEPGDQSCLADDDWAEDAAE
ncbi:uncharacterized protein LOC113233612 [Hyposmocoma kahamanoa]|uniref:uncharacterized protein LOC113233612 n=1 Tax=Hyposmocoma kahamanoa TaxID=1477025 RepID=UPI000E6D97C8|nr:uncharacterized protein LOC113233612 [Hyposmocoma kahamanoa]